MTNLDRRSLVAGAVAASGAALLGPIGTRRAAAATPPAGTQNSGWYRYKVGSHEITVVTDGVNRFKFPDGFVANKTREEVNAGLAAAFLQPAPDMIAVPYTPIVVNTGGKLVVMDTGTGEANLERSKGAAGQFHGNLKAAGIDRNQVDTVIISHFHGDHINGLLTPDNKPSFPNAEILVPAAEWKYFMDDGEMSKQTTERMKGVFAGLRRVFDALGRKVTPYEPDKEVAPGITSVATYGHTPGHNSFIIASGNDKVFVQADVTNMPLFVRNPGWHAMYDQDPNMAESTRRKVYDMLAAERMLVQGFHYPFPSLAHIEKTSTGYRETMVPWSPTL
jgi:glyoxylase-like metal-dependent hydrolase (beta-lactamase superfamily II)